MRLAGTLLTAWAGSLWTVCLLVAPALFAILEDRHAAGRIAAQLFRIEAWLGLALATALLGVRARDRALARRIPWWPLLLAAGAPLASVHALGPLLAAARAANHVRAFGLIHSAAAALFLAACGGALALVWRFNRQAE